MGEKLSQFYHLQIDVVETWQSHPFELKPKQIYVSFRFQAEKN